MTSQNDQKFELINCPKCNGLGYLNNRLCPYCFGWRLVAVFDNRLFVWGEEISNYAFLKNRSRKIIVGIINFIFLLIGLSGILSLGWKIFNSSQSPQSLFEIFYSKDSLMLIFWISLLADLFLFYKFERDQEKIKYLPSLSKKLQKKLKKPLNLINPDKKSIIKIEPYFSFEAKNAIQQSWLKARKFNNFEVLPIHLLIALLKNRQVEVIFGRLGIPFGSLKSRIEGTLGTLMVDENKTIFSEKLIFIIYRSFFSSLKGRQKKS